MPPGGRGPSIAFSIAPQGRATDRGGEQPADPCGNRLWPAIGGKDAAGSSIEQLRRAPDRRRDGGRAVGHGFKQDVGDALTIRAQDSPIDCGLKGRQLRLRHLPHEPYTLHLAHILCLFDQIGFERALANDRQVGLRQKPQGPDGDLMALPRDRVPDRQLGRPHQIHLRLRRPLIGGALEQLQIDAMQHNLDLVGADRQLTHGVLCRRRSARSRAATPEAHYLARQTFPHSDALDQAIHAAVQARNLQHRPNPLAKPRISA